MNGEEAGFNPIASLRGTRSESEDQHNGTKRFKKARETFARIRKLTPNSPLRRFTFSPLKLQNFLVS
jgi:hypothetical protein